MDKYDMENRKSAPEAGTPVLEVRDLKKYYPIKGSSLIPSRRKQVHAVDGVSFSLEKGETLGLVGESGCGKSTTGRLLAGIEKATSGTVRYKGQDLGAMKAENLAKIRTQLQMIFQDPYASLNPRKRVLEILGDPIVYHGLVRRGDVGGRVEQLLEEVGLPRNAVMRYPHEFSGGQRQRIVIARAISLEPEVIICDEPVSALDNSIQAQILNLLKELQEKKGLTYLFIAHGLGAVHYVSRTVAVMYLGKIVECGPSQDIFRNPQHPYSKILISAVPIADPTIRDRKVLVPRGEVPSAVDLPEGCRFAKRCPFATDICFREEPQLLERALPGQPSHMVACYHAGEFGQAAETDFVGRGRAKRTAAAAAGLVANDNAPAGPVATAAYAADTDTVAGVRGGL